MWVLRQASPVAKTALGAGLCAKCRLCFARSSRRHFSPIQGPVRGGGGRDLGRKPGSWVAAFAVSGGDPMTACEARRGCAHYCKSPTTRLTASARMTVLYVNDTSACTSAVRRIARLVTLTSETW